MDFGGFILWIVIFFFFFIKVLYTFGDGFKKGISDKRKLSHVIILFFMLLVLGVYLFKIYFLNEQMASYASCGNLTTVRKFLNMGASPNSEGVDGVYTALTGAVANGHGSVVKLLLDRGASPNQCGGFFDERKSALEWAKMNEHDDIVKMLLLKGADPQFRCK